MFLRINSPDFEIENLALITIKLFELSNFYL